MNVSLGACLGPMQGMGTNYNLTGVLARPQTFGISVFKSPYKSKTPPNSNLALIPTCNTHDAAHISHVSKHDLEA